VRWLQPEQYWQTQLPSSCHQLKCDEGKAGKYFSQAHLQLSTTASSLTSSELGIGEVKLRRLGSGPLGFLFEMDKSSFSDQL
jgi:hypothetical protein